MCFVSRGTAVAGDGWTRIVITHLPFRYRWHDNPPRFWQNEWYLWWQNSWNFRLERGAAGPHIGRPPHLFACAREAKKHLPLVIHGHEWGLELWSIRVRARGTCALFLFSITKFKYICSNIWWRGPPLSATIAGTQIQAEVKDSMVVSAICERL